MKYWPLLVIAALVLAGCGDNPAAPAVGVPSPSPAAASRRMQTRPWLIASPAMVASQLDESTALAALTSAGASTTPAATAAPARAELDSPEAQAPIPTPRPVVLPPNGSPPPTALPPLDPARFIPALATADARATWAQPIPAWMTLEMDAIIRATPTPNRAARNLAILAVAFNDSYFVLDAARARGLAVSEEATLAATARQTLTALYPADAGQWQTAYGVAVWMGAWNHHDPAQAVANGNQLGYLAANAVLDRVRDDGAGRPQTFDWPESIIPPGQPIPTPLPGHWRPMLPSQPIDPLWGQVRLIGLSSTEGLAAAPPPAWDSAEFAATRDAFAAAQHALTTGQRASVQKWDAGPGTVTVAGLWFKIARSLVSDARLDNRATAQVYAAVGITLHNAYVVSRADAYRYLVARPETWMRASDSAWAPTVLTPSAPSYPSDEATASAAVADVLAAFFPAQAAQLTAAADEAARSRVYAGVHWQIDIDAGADQGRCVGQAMLTLIR